MKTLVKVCAVFCIFAFVNFAKCFAAVSNNFYLESSNTNPAGGEEFSINLNIKPNEDLNVAVFRLKLSFDPNVFKYTGIYSDYGSNNFKTSLNNGELTLIFLTSEKGINIQKNTTNTLLEINFKVLSNANTQNTVFHAQIDGVGDYNVKRLPLENNDLTETVKIEEKPKANCNLKSLTAENYTLTPNFDPYVIKYSVTVPAEKSSLEISAIPEDENASVSVNKNVLNSEGKSTSLKVTVIGSDKKTKKIYTLTVNRLKKSGSEKSTSGNSTTGKTNSKANNDSKMTVNNGNNNSLTENSKSNKSVRQNSNTVNIIKNHFNILLFLAVAALCTILGVLIIRSKSNQGPNTKEQSEIFN